MFGRYCVFCVGYLILLCITVRQTQLSNCVCDSQQKNEAVGWLLLLVGRDVDEQSARTVVISLNGSVVSGPIK